MSHFTLRLPKFVLSVVYGLLCLALVSVFPASGQAQALTPLHSFDSYGDGAHPAATLTLASDGNFYGTTTQGGQFGYGTVYRLAPSGVITTIHSFNNTDGNNPYGKLVQASDGNLYGTTVSGGTSGYGTIFKITLGGTLTTIYDFVYDSMANAWTHGYNPYGGLIQATDGNLYGTTVYGGTAPTGGYTNGTVFKITLGGTLTTLASFTAPSTNLYANGYNPYAGLVQARDGNFYGTTYYGGVVNGANQSGVVYQITPAGVLTTLHVFTGNPDGANPYFGSLVQGAGSDTNLYGTTANGGTSGIGTVFKISTAGAETVLYSFAYDSGTSSYLYGYNPYNGLLLGSDGNLYGTTVNGGLPPSGHSAAGAIFKITTSGVITALGAFTSDSSGNYPDGYNPYAGLAQYTDGTLYGTTYNGGPPRNLGTVFKLNTDGTNFTLLDSFTNGFADGTTPYSKVIQASDGNFYGTTNQGGDYNQGVIYKMDPLGNVTILHSFNNNVGDGYQPYSGLVEASDGNLYGTTVYGGVSGLGTIFRISKTGTFATLYTFVQTGSDYANGYYPYGTLIQATDGNLYGTTQSGGTPPTGGYSSGTVFKITLGGTLTTLYSFTAPSTNLYANGYYPYSGVTQASDGNFYGTTYYGGVVNGANQSGVVYKITSAGVLTTLHVFTGNPDGANPYLAPPVQAADGNLYGTTYAGGAYGQGTVYRIGLTGSGYASLRAFSGADGTYPYGGLVQANDNNLYGTTHQGGENNTGSIFRITTSGLLTSLYSFSPLVSTGDPQQTNPDGAYPYATLIQGSNGNLYGTASQGGTAGYGTVFTINVQVPTVTGFSPTSGGVGATITITGTGFTGASAIKFNGTAASFTVLSSTQISAVVPTGATTGKIAVTTPNGIATSATAFTVLSTPAPVVSGFSPASGPAGTLVSLTGSGFLAATGVKFGGVTAPSFIANSDTQLTVVVPTGAVTGPISVTGPGGTGVSLASFTVTASATPTITSFTPISGPVGTLVQINGTNFTSVSAVAFSGHAASFTVNSENQITAVVPTGATTGKITVTTASGAATSAASFTVVTTPPAITSFTPTSGPVGTLVQISGSGFTGATSVKFRVTTAKFEVNSDTLITAVVPTGAITGPISVTTAGGTAISAAFFTVPGTTIPIPTVSSFSPTSGAVGTPVTINGTGLLGASAVSFNGTAAAFTVVSDTQITTSVPAGAATGTISVTTPGGTGTSSASFTVIPPSITSFTPNHGATGTTVTITGTGFSGATGVSFGGVAATTFTVTSPTQITAQVPAGAVTGPISVTALGGTVSSAAVFYATPTLTGFTPTSGAVGTPVTLTGTNFTGATSVKFGTITTTVLTVNSNTQITVNVPANATTGTITVTTPGGTATSAATFTVAPTITSFSPNHGATGTAVTINGTNFTGETSITFNGTTATPTSVTATSIKTTVPAGATTGPITVTTPAGTATSAAVFYATPTLTSFTPTSGAVGTPVTLTGTNFTGATSVKFGTITTTVLTVNSNTQITVNVPAGATTGTITVTTPGGTATSAATFTVAPTITSFSPTSGAVGTSVTISGTNFTGETAVTFNGVASTPTSVTATSIKTTVPTGATTGPIAVTTPGGTATSASNFTVP